MPLPSNDLRSNLATWAVPPWAVPAVVHQMDELLPPEPFDPHLQGQYLQTTYFDTPSFALRRARLGRQQYVTLRLRTYGASTGAGGVYPVSAYALAAKTETKKVRVELKAAPAKALLQEPSTDLLAQLLSPDIFAHLLAIVGDEELMPVVTCTAQRYAVEDQQSRLTLDLNVQTDSGKHLPFGVLEFKSVNEQAAPPGRLPTPGLRPIKLSKFLWATDWR